MPSYSDIASSLTENLQLSQPPIAVRLADALPPGVESWSGHSPAGCRFWQEAATRVFATSAADHSLCSIGQYTHNLEMTPASSTDLMDALKKTAKWISERPPAGVYAGSWSFYNDYDNRRGGLFRRSLQVALAEKIRNGNIVESSNPGNSQSDPANYDTMLEVAHSGSAGRKGQR